MNAIGLLVILVTLSTLLIGSSSKVIAKREVDHHMEDMVRHTAEKRPFCNAFTGCGKKRSSPVNYVGTEYDSNDSNDPITQLSRRVLHEARLWEMFQQRMANSNEVQQLNTPLMEFLKAQKRK